MTPAGAAILGCAGLRLTPDEAAFFRDSDPFGFILFARNVADPDQLRGLTEDLRACLGRDALIFTDQEGGRVQRLRAPHWSEWSPPLEMVQSLAARTAPEQREAAASRAMWLRYRLIGAELRAVGIDGNCAPCLDLATPDTHPFLRNRCLGDSPQAAATLGRAAAEGHLAAGVLPVIKHMPGHGRGTIDSHKDLPVVTAPLAQLRQSDFAPFRALADLPLAMTAHVVFTSVDPDQPATTSPRMIRMMRDDLGFAGLLMTDDLSMNALSGSVAERTSAALAAGCDLALHCNGDLDEMQAVMTAAGRMSAAAKARAEDALTQRKPPEPVDIDALRAEFYALTGGGAHGG
jgi:beta-N-acetylhexosaminidase